MAKGNPAGGIFALMVVLIFVIVLPIFALGIYSEHAQAVDVNNTSSAAMYNGQSEERNIVYSLITPVGILIACALLVGAVALMRHAL